MGENEFPDGDRIYDLYTGAYKPHIIRVALELDVFSPLAASPAIAEAVAQACKCNAEGIRRLLDYLAGLKVQAKQGKNIPSWRMQLLSWCAAGKLMPAT